MWDQMDFYLTSLWRADANTSKKKKDALRGFKFWICFLVTDRGKRMRPLPLDWHRHKNEQGDWVYVNEYTGETVSQRPMKSKVNEVKAAWEQQAPGRWYNTITKENAYQKKKPEVPRILKPLQAYEMKLDVRPGGMMSGGKMTKKVLYKDLSNNQWQETMPESEKDAVARPFYGQPMT